MKLRISKNLFIVLLLDIILLCASFYLAHLIRFDFIKEQWVDTSFLRLLPYVLGCKILFFYLFDLYKGMWRYTSLSDLINIIKASIFSTFIIIAFVLYLTRFEHISRSVFVIDWCLTVMFIAGLRLFVRLCFEAFTEKITLQDVKFALFKIFRKNAGSGRGALIIGAGDYGQKVCREFNENPSVKSRVLGFLDDDRSKIGRKIHGVPVLNVIERVEHTIKSTGAEDVIIAIPSLSADRMRHIVELCKKAGVNFKTIPNLGELINGKIDVTSIRKVEYRDLLGREPVKLDQDQIGKYIGGNRVLVTGAGGSIGSELCRQICRYSPEKIILFERAESALYEIDLELKKNFQDVEVVPVLGDIQNRKELHKVFHLVRPDIVFHAAAYKHVPMLEGHPWKAVENNVFGTKNLIEVTRAFKCDKFVFVSTDKAVNPTSVMGTSKRISELLVQENSCAADCETAFMTVRFGNVIGSVGSVIPLFKKQIEDGGPVTVTHPDIIRYFMLIPEACQLILQAGAMGKGGEIFILEMGKPVKIDNMARDLIRFSGFEPDVDIKIEYTGLRPGEKLYEELMTDLENVVSTDHKKIMVLNTNCVNMGVLNGKLDQLKAMAEARDGQAIRNLMMEMIPEYRPN
ncbi:polysaccharide biosynthesis protein [Desulfobacter hydrogenophilus]|uniref:Polysaccharide biosynthesis protein n=1 Tax=Desulfobacter hydrogenophilus TaxID=2291 RepID=A0A328F5R7_9BACT|nr:nucleoside-diphosphate sugar epimerase/dehydratase [Desulfobacter hydrogenophilus]NDY74560.1 polysaccharide biosynthesis protein [Desulfobacter hydrogenophilus]QBH15430.1 polysaccharide biosynthesis protein [Desulfobacter hydrogenophilus]RAL99870.1 polysaccharide biosynthesis protein [Desulfobacter hydrogenophilus]